MDHETVPTDAIQLPPEGQAYVQWAITTDGGMFIGGCTIEVGPFDDGRTIFAEMIASVPYVRVRPAQAIRLVAVQPTLFDLSPFTRP